LKFLRSSFWFQSVFFTLLQRFSLFFFGAASFMMLVRGFKPQTFSAWALYIVIISIFESIKQGLLRNPAIKFLSLPEYKNRITEVQTASIIINFLFTLIYIVLVIAFGRSFSLLLNSPELHTLLTGSIILVLLMIPFTHCEIILQAHFRFESIFLANVIRQGIFFAGIVIFFFFLPWQFSLINILALQVLSIVCGLIVMGIYSRLFVSARLRFDSFIIKHMLQFGKYIFGTNLLSQVARNLDHFMTANMLPPITAKHFVAYYNSVSRINNMVDVPSLAAADVLFPKNVQVLQSEGIEKVKYYFEKMVATIIAIILPLSLIIFLFPGLILFIIAGPEYYAAAPILQITILFGLVRPLSYQFGSTLDAIGKPRVNFIANAMFFVTGVLLNYILISLFGGMGPAYATAVNAVISLVVMILVLKKYMRIELSKIVKYIGDSYRDFFTFSKKIFKKSYGS
jgi:O-antigen/teichoic acid export membrane protein